jgi:hypothetical protein
MGAAATLTVVLAQNTTSAAFTAQTADTANQVTASPDFCTAPGRVDTLPSPAYPTVVDTGLYESQAGVNFSSDPKFGVVAPSGGRVRSLIKFTLPTRPSGCVVASATMKLHMTNGVAGASVVVYRAAATWDPTAVRGASTPVSSSAAVRRRPRPQSARRRSSTSRRR